MAKTKKNNILIKLYIIFILISFLFPIGTYRLEPSFKSIHSILIWISTALIWFQTITYILGKKQKKDIYKTLLSIGAFFAYIIIITAVTRGSSLNSGFQKMIAMPSMIPFFIINFKQQPKFLLKSTRIVIASIFIAHILTIQYFAEHYTHMTIIGHVQSISQIGSLFIFLSLLEHKLYKTNFNITIFECIICLIIMLTTDAASAQYIAIILVLIAILYKFSYVKKLFSRGMIFYLILFAIINILTVFVSVENYNNIEMHNKTLDFSGRGVVWNSAINAVNENPLFGYGIDGINIDVFWNHWGEEDVALTYAHNQALQNLLDGGIVAFILFTIAVYSCLKKVPTITNKEVSRTVNIFLCIFLLNMVFESTSFYCYFYIFLGLSYALTNTNNKEIKNGTNIKH